MRNHLILILLFILYVGRSVAAPDGSLLYQEHCSVCHGNDGKGGVGIPISLPGFLNSVSDDYIAKTIRYGRPGRIMPSFDELSDAQIKAITGYVTGWRTRTIELDESITIKGDEVNGEKVYRANCQRCHGEDGEGGKGTGVTFSRKRDLPIIAPALNNPGFLRSASDAMLRDTITYGREGTPMTSALVLGLEPRDIDDVIAYIRSYGDIQRESLLTSDGDFVISEVSPYSMEETIENLKQAITGQNFTLIRVEELDKRFMKESESSRKQMVMHFCNFGFLFEALSIDPRVGMFLPCRLTLTEDEAGVVTVSAINPLRLSRLFNNEELDEACHTMHDLYRGLIEDAVL